MANPATDEIASAYGRGPHVHPEWEQVHPDYGDLLLRATIHIHGVPHHMQATAVDQENDRQVATHFTLDYDLESLYEHAEPDGLFDTVDINGRAYVVSAYPYS